jgi:Fe-S-cluster-containing dehydrogenase component
MAEERTLVDRITAHLDLPPETTRRGFLRVTLGATIVCPVISAWAGDPRLVLIENAEGVLVSDNTRCVGCGRCELACTEFNEGKAQPSLARIKVSRNYNFGPRGQQAGIGRGMGEYGDFRVVKDTCLQCPNPVPCVAACTDGAFVVDNKTKARVVDPKKCTGCRKCLRACPWDVMTFDEAAAKASKCFLCNGNPECVQACPTTALRYVSWHDLTRATPIRQATWPIG